MLYKQPVMLKRQDIVVPKTIQYTDVMDFTIDSYYSPKYYEWLWIRDWLLHDKRPDDNHYYFVVKCDAYNNISVIYRDTTVWLKDNEIDKVM